MGEPVLHVLLPPRSLGLRRFGSSLDPLGEFQEPFRGVGPAVEERVFDPLEQIFGDLLVNRQLARVDDAHVHARLDRVIEESGVHRFPHRVVAAEGKRDIAHPSGEVAAGIELPEPARRFDEVLGVVVMLLDPRGDDEDVGVEEEVAFIETDLLREDLVDALADPEPFLDRGRLLFLVEGHRDHRGPVAFDQPRAPLEFLLAFFEGERIDDRFALDAL